MKTAIVSGVSGMDGIYMTELLLSKGYRVVGFHRQNTPFRVSRVSHLLADFNFSLQEGSLCDRAFIDHIIGEVQPDLFFNAGAQSSVSDSFKNPQYTFEVNLGGVTNCLESIKRKSKDTRFVQFSSSEIFGNNRDSDLMQRETTPVAPKSPYAVSKLAADELCKMYRDTYGIFACSAICFNHTGPRRSSNFVEKKIVNWIKRHKDALTNNLGVYSSDNSSVFSLLTANGSIYRSKKLNLGNISVKRDFGHAKDYMRAILAISEADRPADYVIATETAYSIEDILDYIFKKFNLDYKELIYIDPGLFRPSDTDFVCGDSTSLKDELGWSPKYSMQQILDEMLDE